ncbi:MAG: CPBP family intramembrane metalloprotease [Lachnospiraceae bacterium]|nr:CPBP family intramembrane metalloprotease [Lachnospiraceae bacterium]
MERLSITKTSWMFAIYFAIYMVLAFLVRFFLPEDAPIVFVLTLSSIVLLVPIFLILGVLRLDPRNFLGRTKFTLVDILWSILAAYCVLPVMYVINLTTMMFHAQNHVNGILTELVEYPLLLQILLMAVLPAASEEFIFRGVFYGSYRRRNYLGAAVISGLFFGLMHMNINQACYAFVLGILFSFFYEAIGNLWGTIIAHTTINLGSVLGMNMLSYAEEIGLVDPTEAAAGMEAANNGFSSAEMVAVKGAVIFLSFVAILGLFFFYQILRHLAKTHGRLEYFEAIFKERGVYHDAVEGKFLSPALAVAVVPAFILMILSEL